MHDVSVNLVVVSDVVDISVVPREEVSAVLTVTFVDNVTNAFCSTIHERRFRDKRATVTKVTSLTLARLTFLYCG